MHPLSSHPSSYLPSQGSASEYATIDFKGRNSIDLAVVPTADKTFSRRTANGEEEDLVCGSEPTVDTPLIYNQLESSV